jgi:glycosyltransferase involved in cell wall biosynthesis
MEQFKKRVHYIGMGYDPNKTLDSPKENSILYLGKIDKMKQVPSLLRAWKNIGHSNDWKLVLAGDGSDYDYCVNYAKNIGLTDYEFLGYVGNKEKWKLYSKAKLFAFPSLYEGFGIVLLEALNEGCVPIVNDLPPMNEVVTPEVGFLTNPTVDSWAKTLRIAMNSDLAKKKVHIPKFLDKYNWEDVCERLERIIEMYASR